MDKSWRVHIKVGYLIVGKGISRRKFKHFKIYFCLFPHAKCIYYFCTIVLKEIGFTEPILGISLWLGSDTIWGNRMLISTTCSGSPEFSKRKAEFPVLWTWKLKAVEVTDCHILAPLNFRGAPLPHPSLHCASALVLGRPLTSCEPCLRSAALCPAPSPCGDSLREEPWHTVAASRSPSFPHCERRALCATATLHSVSCFSAGHDLSFFHGLSATMFRASMFILRMLPSHCSTSTFLLTSS